MRESRIIPVMEISAFLSDIVEKPGMTENRLFFIKPIECPRGRAQ